MSKRCFGMSLIGRSIVFLLTVVLLASESVFAVVDEFEIQLSVDRTQLVVGDDFNMTVLVSTKSGGLSFGQTPKLTLPEGIEVTGSSSSTSNAMNIVNGSVTTSVTTRLNYSVRATRAGSFVLGPLRMDHKGKSYESNKIRVDVGKVQRGSGAGSAPDIPGSGNPGLKQIQEALFVSALPDKKRVYVGEQVTLSYNLFTRQNINNVNYANIPTYTGFWSEPLFDTQRLNFKREMLDGKEYHRAPLKVTALFPTTSGKHQLEQLELICDVPDTRAQQRRFDAFGFEDLFRGGAGGRTQKVRLRSNDVELEVLPLPDGAPPGFEGAVGKYKISVLVSPTSTVVGEPVSLKLVVSGSGNLSAIPRPKYESGRMFKIYDPKETVQVEKQGTRIGGRKTFEYVIIPQEAGTLEIPSFSMPYFDPVEKQYRTARTDPVRLNVGAGDKHLPAAGGTALTRNEIQVLGQDIRYLKPDLSHLDDHGVRLLEDWKFLALNIVPILGFAGVVLYKRHRNRMSHDVAYARRRRSTGEARKRLTKANQLLGETVGGELYSELNDALSQFLADRLNVPTAAITPDSARALLLDKDVQKEMVEEVRGLLEQCDYARFAPGSATSEVRAKDYSQAEKLISALDSMI
jgi:hypothetical protein